MISWIELFLSQRIFELNVNWDLYETAEAINCVPQGCVIGQIFLAIYVSD